MMSYADGGVWVGLGEMASGCYAHGVGWSSSVMCTCRCENAICSADDRNDRCSMLGPNGQILLETTFLYIFGMSSCDRRDKNSQACKKKNGRKKAT